MSKTKILRNSLYMTALLCGTGAMLSCSDDNNGDIDYKNGTPSFTIKATMSQDMIDLTHTIIFAQDPDGNVEAELLDSRTWEVSFTKDKTPASAGYAIYYYLKDEYDRDKESRYQVSVEYGAYCYVDGELAKVSTGKFNPEATTIDNIESYLRNNQGPLKLGTDNDKNVNKKYTIDANGITVSEITDDERPYSEKARQLLSDMGITQSGKNTIRAYSWDEALAYFVKMLKMADLNAGLKTSYKWEDCNVEIIKDIDDTTPLVATMKIDFKSGSTITESYEIEMGY